jgi:cytochrome c oxidase subunit II
MKRFNLSFALAIVLPALLLGMLYLASPRKARADATPRVLEITAKRFEFSPSQITLKKGETVKLRLVSQDVHHGFFLRPLKLDEEIAPGEATEVTVTPQTAGTFTLICDHFCGENHGNMKMTVIVED